VEGSKGSNKSGTNEVLRHPVKRGTLIVFQSRTRPVILVLPVQFVPLVIPGFPACSGLVPVQPTPPSPPKSYKSFAVLDAPVDESSNLPFPAAGTAGKSPLVSM
jgi:hypothetical protein